MEADYRVDRSNWPAGEWDSEPDRLSWTDRETGLPCLIVRNRMGALCGYVAVERGHQAYRKDQDDIEVYVHGGLTYSDLCNGHICHTPEPGKPADVWWLGFDCNHYLDWSPRSATYERDRGDSCFKRQHEEIYRNVAYVQDECASLAKQLSAMRAA